MDNLWGWIQLSVVFIIKVAVRNFTALHVLKVSGKDVGSPIHWVGKWILRKPFSSWKGMGGYGG